ncbi:ABC-2 type transport system permease protein [Mariniflexile fucanivorans]|uniref:ABC-2 type transport system permease protein n=1 Tax=Mariniflexile fucanivorans TaxID=264023 RepID=A0A4R1RIZ4_9FLAO|nr:ABC transporter permease [Mariniflexile fucanivorans]TCL65976.1 ABC-2 type transport system permease protein [Mariniflexile fucanivorans]
MKPMFRIAKREVGLLLNSKTLFVFAVILPFVSFLFFSSLLKVGVARNLPIAVIDLDNSAISRNVISQLDATPELQISHTLINQQEGESLIRQGEIYGLVTIQKDFEADLKNGKQVTILNQYNNNVLLPGGLEFKAFSKVIGTISAQIYIQKQLVKGVSFQQAVINYQPVSLENHVLSNPYTNYSYYLNSGFLAYFFQIIIILTTIYCFGSDLKYIKGNQLLRISNGKLSPILLGKILPYTIWFFFVGLIMYYTMFVWQDFPLNGSKIALLIGLILLIISSQCFGLLFLSLSNSFREALTIGSGFAAISLSFSGITFPIFSMPLVLKWISQIFPFTHFFKLFMEQSQQGFPVYYSFKTIIVLMLLCALPIIFFWKKLTKLFIKGEFNHRI